MRQLAVAATKGVNERNLGAALALTVLYATFGSGGRGVSAGVWVAAERGGWRARGLLGHFFPISEALVAYTEVDALEITREAGQGQWALGAALDAWESEGETGGLIGPALRRNDRHGAWSLWLRFGEETELRLTWSHAF